ncbi:MAG: avidin/streptavidin family protein [Allosphingosinicella sp.]
MPGDFPVGTWTNELGSTLQVTSVLDGVFSGVYSSTVSGGGPSVQGSVSGTFSGEAIAFTANWGPSQSVTAWTGVALASGESGYFIYALWHLASSPTQDADWWESILAGADLFYMPGPNSGAKRRRP